MTVRGKRVLFVDCAPFTGGAQRSLLTLAQALRDEGIEVQVLAADLTPGGVVEQCLRLDLPVAVIPARHWSRTPLGLWQFVVDRRRIGPQLRERVASWQPDILHANTVRAALLVPRELSERVPLVVHDRDLPAPWGVRRLVGARARAILAIGGALAAAWPRACVGRLHLVPNGLEVVDIARTLPAASAIGRVALVADFVHWKGHELFLRAFASVRATHPEARAVLVGRVRNGDAACLEEVQHLLAELRLEDRVTILDSVTCAWPQIAACRLLVSCAAGEPFGRTVVEALALGKPVVAVRGGGPEEILAGCPAGTLVEARAPAIAEAILNAWHWVDDPTCAAAARQRAECFSVQRMSERIRAVYRDLLTPVRDA